MENGTHPHFVIIDDDDLNIRITQRHIERAFQQHGLSTFTDPLFGLEFIRSEKARASDVTVILLDIRMPRLSGWEFVEQFSLLPEDARKHFKIYMFSSSVSREDRQMAEDSPFVCRFIEKPIVQRELEVIRTELCN